MYVYAPNVQQILAFGVTDVVHLNHLKQNRFIGLQPDSGMLLR